MLTEKVAAGDSGTAQSDDSVYDMAVRQLDGAARGWASRTVFTKFSPNRSGSSPSISP